MVNKQSFLNAVYQDIEMVRGDTLAFNFEIDGLAENAPENIIFRCAETYADEPLFTASFHDGVSKESYSSGKALYSVWIDPDKTINLELASYYYDLALITGDDVITLMRGRLTLLYEVSRG